jgi:MFS family permease
MWITVSLGFCMSFGLSMTRPAAVLYGSQIGMSAFDIGVLVAVFSLLPTLIAIRAGMAIDRFGDRTPLVGGYLLTAVGFVLPCLMGTEPVLYVSQILVGTGQLVVATSLQNLVGNSSTSARRDANFALFGTLISAGNLAGPFIGGIVSERFSYLTVFAIAAVASLAAAALALVLPRQEARGPVQRSTLAGSMQLLRLPSIQRALLSGTLIQYSRDIFLAYFPLYGEYVGFSPFEIGLTLSCQGAAMFAARSFLPYLLRRFPRERLLIWAVLLSGVTFLVVPLTSLTLITYLAAALMGFGLGGGQPITMTETFNASPPGRTGEVLGLRMTAYRGGQFVAPLFFGGVGAAFGILGVFFVNGALLLGGGYAMSRRQP